MSDVATVLVKARDLISDPARWTTGCYARDACGRRIPEDRYGAVCWCMSGAIWRVANQDFGLVDTTHRALADFIDTGDTVVQYNDSHQHAEVLALLDRAIVRLQTADSARVSAPPTRDDSTVQADDAP